MSAESVWKAKLDRADQRIAELEEKLRKSQIQAQIFANAIGNAAVRLDLVETADGLDGLALLGLVGDIIKLAGVLKKLETDFEALAATHLIAHKAATTERMIEWERGLWEAYKHAAGHVNRRGENSGV